MARWVWNADGMAVVNLNQVTYVQIFSQGESNYGIRVVWTAGESENNFNIASSISLADAQGLVSSLTGIPVDVQP